MTELKKEIENILHPEKAKLHPPTAQKSRASETSTDLETETIEKQLGERTESIVDSKLAPDFNQSHLSWTDAKQWLLDNSSFDRALMEFVKKVVPGLEGVDVRGSKKVMVKSFNKNVQNFRGVMNEFKEKVQKLRGKRIE